MSAFKLVILTGLALVTGAWCDDSRPLSALCKKSVGQRICSTYYFDHLVDCIRGLEEDSFVRMSSSICLRLVPDYCVTEDVCKKETDNKPDQPKASCSNRFYYVINANPLTTTFWNRH